MRQKESGPRHVSKIDRMFSESLPETHEHADAYNLCVAIGASRQALMVRSRGVLAAPLGSASTDVQPVDILIVVPPR